MSNKMIDAFVRSIGWTAGRRVANRMPLWLLLLIIIVVYSMGGK